MGDLVPTGGRVPSRARPLVGRSIVRSLDDVLQLAHVVAVGGTFGPYRNRPEAAATVMLQALELGLSPVQGLTSIHLVDNRSCLSAEMMRGLVLQAGHDITILELTDQVCRLAGRRTGQAQPTTVAFSIADAQRAGVAGRGSWKAYPQAMLLARATTLLCRAVFPDVLLGVSYTAEELGYDPEQPEPPTGDDVAEVPGAALASDEQYRRVIELQHRLGLDDAQLTVGLLAATAGRCRDADGLTADEADLVIDRMTARAQEVVG